MRISVIGSGRVGTVVAACLAKLGNKVTVVDIDKEKIKTINSKVSPVYEPGLDEILSQVNIKATSDYSKIEDSDIIFICVNTPSKEDGSISLEYITEAAKQIAVVLRKKKDYCVITVKSTVVPGTTDQIIVPILESSGKRAGDGFGICMVPEFLRGGKAVYDFLNPARVITGEYDGRSGDVLSYLYQSFNAPILRTNLRTAEMIKYASNAFLATKISFINEIGNICKLLGIDTYQVAKGMGFDDRIGSKYLNAGIGFGGSCLPKDLKALIARAKHIGYEPRVLEEVLNLNDQQALKMIELLNKHIHIKDSCIGLLGLSYKPETDEAKDSLVIKVVNTLLKKGAKIKVYDPLAIPNFKRSFPQIEYTILEEVLKCDAILILTEWEEFEHLDYSGAIVIDGRRILKAKEARIYEGICW